MKVAIAGAGAFGTALAVTLAAAGREVTLWGRDPAGMATAARDRQMPRLPGMRLDPLIEVTADTAALGRAEAVLLAVPAQTLRGFLRHHAALLDGRPLVACAKGIDLETLTGPTALIAAACPAAIPAMLTGPSFAGDIARGLPTALTLACGDEVRATDLQHALSTPSLRLYRTTDLAGAEFGGALKNVIAIACGATIGAGLGESARAALMTRGFAEVVRLSTRLGARAETLAGLSGFGDLVLTCTSAQSRNYRFGLSLGEGSAFDPAVTVEGAATARSVVALAGRHGIEMPVSSAVAALVTGSITVAEALHALISRPLKEE